MKYLIVLVAMLLTFSCQKDEPITLLNPDTSKTTLNEVIYSVMKDMYLWYDKIPQADVKDTAAPALFLEKLLNKPIDRWSYVTPKADFDKYYTQGKFFGHGFSFQFDSAFNMRIAYVFKNSELYTAGIRRGWIVETINAQKPDTSNVWQLIGGSAEAVVNTFIFRNNEGTTVNLTTAKKELTLNMVLAADTFHVGTKTVGHLVFKGFIANAENELKEAFTYFKKARIDELVLDMRYNGGGDLSICTKLASMIAGHIANNKTFVTLTYSDKHAQNTTHVAIQENDYTITLPRLIVIASKQTASASEAIINGLRPYMDVEIIGSNTYGKPAGMNVYTIKKYNYVLVPVTFKLTNKDGFGDYFDGLPASKLTHDDVTHDFSDKQESCLNEALYFIGHNTYSLRHKSASNTYVYAHKWTGLYQEIGSY